MAKLTITFEDVVQDGVAGMEVELSGDLPEKNDTLSQAQAWALETAHYIHGISDGAEMAASLSEEIQEALEGVSQENAESGKCAECEGRDTCPISGCPTQH
jgi:hypothetical protein